MAINEFTALGEGATPGTSADNWVDATGNVEMLLPPITAMYGQSIRYTKSDATAGTLTVIPCEATGVTINGDADYVISTQFESAEFVALDDAVDWAVIITTGDAAAVAGDLATHEADTTTHGTTGAIVGTTDTQDLTNKTINKITITAPATGATLTIPDGVTFTGPGASGTAATLTGTETLTNKKLVQLIVAAAADGAIAIQSGIVPITKASAGAFSVAAPSSQDGTRITFMSTTAFAHVITFTGATLQNGVTANSTTATLPNVAGASLTVIANGVLWYVESQQGTIVYA